MVGGSNYAVGSLVAVDAHGVEEWSGEVVLGRGVDAVSLYPTGGVDVVAVVVVDGDVGHAARVGIAEEKEVAGAARAPVAGFYARTRERLLRGVAPQYYSVCQIGCLCQARAVEGLY